MRNKIQEDTRSILAIYWMILEDLKEKNKDMVSFLGQTPPDPKYILAHIAMHMETGRRLDKAEDLVQSVQLSFKNEKPEFVFDRVEYAYSRSHYPDDIKQIQKSIGFVFNSKNDFKRLRATFRLKPLEEFIDEAASSLAFELDKNFGEPGTVIDHDFEKKCATYLSGKYPNLSNYACDYFAALYCGNPPTKLIREDEVEILRTMGWIQSDKFTGIKLTRVLHEIRKQSLSINGCILEKVQFTTVASDINYN